MNVPVPATPISPMANPPHNVELEQAVLGAVLVNNNAIDNLSQLDPQHFFEAVHGEIFEVSRKLIQAGKQATPITLKTFFENAPPVGPLTVPQYLGRLAVNATSIANAKHYAQEIVDLANRRAIIELAGDLNHAALVDHERPPKEVLEEFEGRIYELTGQGRLAASEYALGSAMLDAVVTAQRAKDRGTGLSGLSTGIRAIDRMMGGLAPSDLIVVAGRPAMGKTALAVNLALNVVRQHRPSANERNLGASVGFFSLEMSAEQLAARTLSEMSGISSADMMRGKLNDEQLDTIHDIAVGMAETPFKIDDRPALSVGQITATARRWKRKHDIGLLIVDYIQLAKGNSGRTRNEEVGEITTGLKALAKELNIPVIALSQLSRAVEQRDNKRPTLSDLRESGSIEQDADIVMFVFREDYYIEKNKPDQSDGAAYLEWQQSLSAAKGKAEAIFAKHRHGPCGTANLRFNASTTTFSDVEVYHGDK